MENLETKNLRQKIIFEQMENEGRQIFSRLKKQGFYICRSGSVHYIKDRDGKTLVNAFSVPALFRDLYLIMM